MKIEEAPLSAADDVEDNILDSDGDLLAGQMARWFCQEASDDEDRKMASLLL